VVVKGLGVAKDGLPHGAGGPMAIGIVTSAVTGYFAIRFMLAYVRRRSYDVFVVYRLAAAIAVALIIATDLRPSTF
jgi:undecaprenyl-diphosphatase